MLSHTLYEIFKNINDVLYDKRGYERSELYNLPFEDFQKLTRNDLTIKTKSRLDSKYNNDPLYVYFPDESKVGIKSIKLYKSEMEENNIKHAILIVINNVTSCAKNIIKSEFKEENINIEIFDETFFLTNRSKHVIVPLHEILLEDEKKKLKEKYCLKSFSNLPCISEDDPQVRILGAKKKDIIKIYRLSETSGISLYYRIVN